MFFFLFFYAGKHPRISCNHGGPRTYCKHQNLQAHEIQDQFNEFYVDSDKLRQDQFISSCLILVPPKRKRVSDNQRKRNIPYIIHYYVSMISFSITESMLDREKVLIMILGQECHNVTLI